MGYYMSWYFDTVFILSLYYITLHPYSIFFYKNYFINWRLLHVQMTQIGLKNYKKERRKKKCTKG